MRAIVTGGAGFIGSHVVDALLARGDEVHVLDDLSKGRRERRRRRRELHVADIREPTTVFDTVGPRSVFHLAAQADVRVSVERPDYDADVNVLGTMRILEAARRHGAKIVFSSTGGAIYGECDGPAAGDGAAAAARAVRDVEAVRRGVPRDVEPASTGPSTCRFGSATSTGRARSRTARPGSSRSSWGCCSTAARRRSSATERRRATTSTSATSRARCSLALDREAGGVFNVGTGIETSVLELYDAIQEASGVDARPRSSRRRGSASCSEACSTRRSPRASSAGGASVPVRRARRNLELGQDS